MTAEIAIMNRNAVVLAADSATTVSSWKDGKLELRYFKGANKLFELSCHAPVGLMIYGSAALQGVPWELAVKAFRQALGTTQHDHLEGYAADFFNFIAGNEQLFTEKQKFDSLIDALAPAAWRLQRRIAHILGADDPNDIAAVPANQVADAIAEAREHIGQIQLHEMIEEADVQSAIAKCKDLFTGQVLTSLPLFASNSDRAHLAGDFTELFIELGVREYVNFAGLTGIVIAGYGQSDYFPTLEVYECYGFLDKKLVILRDPDRSKHMSSSAQAVIEPFATTGTIDTFRFGVGPDAFNAILEATRNSLTQLAQTVLEESAPQSPISAERIQALVDQITNQHLGGWWTPVREQHFSPLSNVIHSLPLPEMAALAKSLIELESLKERVTKPSESVAGPIDVAVISKYDGFVWIDRKHYFRPELNPRFLRRFESL